MVSYDRGCHHNNDNSSSGPSKETEHSAGFCRELFDLVRDLFAALHLSGRVSNGDSEEAFLAQNEAGRFRIWGSGFDVEDGGLDELLDGSVLQSAVVVQFVGIARKLSRYVERDSDLFRYLVSTLERAEYLFPEAIEDECEETLDLLETLEDVSILNDGLYQLTPFLESIPIEYEEAGETQHPGLITTGTAEIKALYVNILDKWPSAEANLGLVDRLAELNGRRKRRLWELKDRHDKAPPEPLSPGGGSVYSPSSYAPSTRHTMGSSIASVPSSLQTLQDDRYYAESEVSMSSYNSRDLAVVGVTRIPPPPVRLGPGVSFECNLCFETMYGIETKYQWKKHIFKDLQPYSCSFLQCPLPSTHLFNSRAEWVNHEFDIHRTLPCWLCITDCGLEFDDQNIFREHLHTHLGTGIPENELSEIVKKCVRRKPIPAMQTTVCPLCRETIPETKRSISKHLGRHMEEISLAVVPTENYNLDWEESSEESDMSSTDEEDDRDFGRHISPEARRRTTELVARTLTTCFKRIHARYSKLLTLADKPDWAKKVFALVRTYDMGGQGLSLLREDILLDMASLLGEEPEIVGIRSTVSFTEDYDLFLDQKIDSEVDHHLYTRQAAPSFQQCHSCGDVSISSRHDCPHCGHDICGHCERAVLSNTLHPSVEGQLMGFARPTHTIGPSTYPPADVDVVTRSVVIDKKHYPRLIGAGGVALAEIISGAGGPTNKSAQSRVVRFPRSDSPSNRVVVKASLHVAEAIVERMKSKVAEFGAQTSSSKGLMSPAERVMERHEKAEQLAGQRHSPALSGANSRSPGPSRPTISVGRATSLTDVHGKGKAPALRPSPEVKPWDHEGEIGNKYLQEPVTSRSTKRRRRRKKKADGARREAEK